jgi:hypothetical protein
MATERQIEANRRNAARSSGPRSPAGKARSRKNATRHGLAGQLPEVEVELSPAFVDRREKWAAGVALDDPAKGWAMDKAVAASLRIDRCQRAFEDVIVTSKARATLSWDEDREVEASLVFGRLGRDPVVASRQLRANLAGVGLLLEAWLGLLAALEDGSNWSESEATRALDLLGVAPDIRRGRTVIDPFDETDPVAFRRALALDEVERLEALRDDSMVPLDELDRRQARVGDIAMLSRPARLVLRYERDAWRRYRESMDEAQSGAGAADPAPRPTKVPALGRPAATPCGNLADIAASGRGPEVATPAHVPGSGPTGARLDSNLEIPRKEPLPNRDSPTPAGGFCLPSPLGSGSEREGRRVAEGVRKPPGKDRTGGREKGRSAVGTTTAAASSTSFEDQRRELQAAARPFLLPVLDGLRAMGFEDEDAMLAELERRVQAGPGGHRVTEQTQFGGGPADRGLANPAGREVDRRS